MRTLEIAYRRMFKSHWKRPGQETRAPPAEVIQDVPAVVDKIVIESSQGLTRFKVVIHGPNGFEFILHAGDECYLRWLVTDVNDLNPRYRSLDEGLKRRMILHPNIYGILLTLDQAGLVQSDIFRNKIVPFLDLAVQEYSYWYKSPEWYRFLISLWRDSENGSIDLGIVAQYNPTANDVSSLKHSFGFSLFQQASDAEFEAYFSDDSRTLELSMSPRAGSSKTIAPQISLSKRF